MNVKKYIISKEYNKMWRKIACHVEQFCSAWQFFLHKNCGTIFTLNVKNNTFLSQEYQQCEENLLHMNFFARRTMSVENVTIIIQPSPT